jgi:hypothetical protein
MKPLVKAISLTILLVTLLCACDHVQVIEYSEDYTQKYKATLDAIFNNNWTVISKTKTSADSMDSSKTFITTEWTIQYTIKNNETREFILTNDNELSWQIERYIEENIVGKYYKEKFFDHYMQDIPLTQSSDLHCSFVNMSGSDDNEEFDMEKYEESIETPQGAIDFTKLTPANVFEKCPLYLNIDADIYVSYYSQQDNRALEEHTKEQLKRMITDMKRFTSDKINAHISVTSNARDGGYLLYDEKEIWRWAYLRGEEIKIDSDSYFDRDVYGVYKGVCW